MPLQVRACSESDRRVAHQLEVSITIPRMRCGFLMQADANDATSIAGSSLKGLPGSDQISPAFRFGNIEVVLAGSDIARTRRWPPQERAVLMLYGT